MKTLLKIADEDDSLHAKCPLCYHELNAEWLKVNRIIISKWVKKFINKPILKDYMNWGIKDTTDFVFNNRKHELNPCRKISVDMKNENNFLNVFAKCVDLPLNVLHTDRRLII